MHWPTPKRAAATQAPPNVPFEHLLQWVATSCSNGHLQHRRVTNLRLNLLPQTILGVILVSQKWWHHLNVSVLHIVCENAFIRWGKQFHPRPGGSCSDDVTITIWCCIAEWQKGKKAVRLSERRVSQILVCMETKQVSSEQRQPRQQHPVRLSGLRDAAPIIISIEWRGNIIMWKWDVLLPRASRGVIVL